jgi:hypothetical protein
MLTAMRKRFRESWDIIRHFLAVRSLLDLLGVTGMILGILVGFLSWLWTHFTGMSWPEMVTIITVLGTCTTICIVFIRIYRRVLAAESHAAETSKASLISSSPPLTDVKGPEIVVDYLYSENSKDNHDQNRPLVLRNISNEQAYNVQVLPLETEFGRIQWVPPLIPYIEGKKELNVFADLTGTGTSPLFTRRIPDFLFKSYRDSSVEELFGVKTFRLGIRYKGVGPEVFETTCELLFRPWKKRTSIGRTERKILRSVSQSG